MWVFYIFNIIVKNVYIHFENIQEEMETLVATSEENSATIQSISETIAAQNNSVKDILTEIDEIAGVSTKLEEHFDMEQAQCE